MDDSRVRKASELLGSILSPDAASKMGQWAQFYGAWARIAGDQFAAHSRPVDLANGIVVIGAEHPGWIQLLQLQEDKLLAKLRASFPDLGIKGIAFKLARDPSVALPQRQRKEPKPETEADRAAKPRPKASDEPPPRSVEETIAGAADPEFKSALASFARTLGTP